MLIKVVANILINTLVLTWLHTETFLDGKDLFGLLPEASTPCFIKSGPLCIFSITFHLVGQFQ